MVHQRRNVCLSGFSFSGFGRCRLAVPQQFPMGERKPDATAMILGDGRLGAGFSDWLPLKPWQQFVLGFNHFIVIKDVHYVISAAGPLIWSKADVLFMPLFLPSFLSDSIISTGGETGREDWNNIFSWIQFESCQIKKDRDTIFHHPHSAQTFQQLAAMGGACEGLG